MKRSLYRLSLLPPLVVVAWMAYRWPEGALVACYLGVALLFALFFVIESSRFGTQDKAEFLIARTAGKLKVMHFRGIAGGLLDGIVVVLSWPVYLVIGPALQRSLPPGRSRISWMAMMQGTRTELWEATYALLLLSLGFASSSLFRLTTTLWPIALFAFASPFIRLLGVAVSGNSIARRSKQWAHPYLTFVALSASYAILLVVGWEAFLAWVRGDRISSAKVIVGLRHLTTAVPLRTLLTSPPTRPTDIAFTVASLLFYNSLFSTLVQRKEFARDANDLCTIAARMVILGKYKQANRLLADIAPATLESNTIQSVALLGMERYHDALLMSDRALRTVPYAEVVDLIAPVHLLAQGMKFQLSMPILRQLYLHWLRLGVHPYQLLLAHVYEGPKRTAEIQELDDVLNALRTDKHDIHLAALSKAVGRIDEAKAMILSAHARTGVEEVYRLAYKAHVAADGTTDGTVMLQNLSQWSAEHLQALQDQALQCRPFGMVQAATLISEVYQVFARSGHPNAASVAAVKARLLNELADQGADFANESIERYCGLGASSGLRARVRQLAASADKSWKSINTRLSGAKEMNCAVLILADGTPCIMYDEKIPHVRNIELDEKDHKVILVWLDSQTGTEVRHHRNWANYAGKRIRGLTHDTGGLCRLGL